MLKESKRHTVLSTYLYVCLSTNTGNLGGENALLHVFTYVLRPNSPTHTIVTSYIRIYLRMHTCIHV